MMSEFPPQHSHVPAESITLLVVEPDRALRVALTELLTRWGYRALAAADRAAALQLLARSSVRLVLQDRELPPLPGALLLPTPFMPWELRRWLDLALTADRAA